MGTFVLVSGENNSGKSAFAESLVGKLNGERYYIATMIAHTEENYMRIEKHRRQREPFGFCTLELPYQVEDAPVTSEGIVLIEDISNLLANNIFEKGKNADCVFQDVCKLLKRCRVVVAVTISGLSSAGYDAKTSSYIDSLNEINQKLFDISSVAITMQDAIPVCQKGELHEIF